MLASTACDGCRTIEVPMGVKADKTYEEIVERLAALFKLTPRPGDRDYEEAVEGEPGAEGAPPASQPLTTNPDKKK